MLRRGLRKRQAELREHIFGAFGQNRAMPNEVVRTPASGIERRPWYSEHIAALLKRQARRDQRARAGCRFDDHDAQRHPGNYSVAAWKMPRLRLGPQRQLGDDHAATRQRVVQTAVFWRIDDIDAAGNHGDAACFESSQMSGGVNPTSKTGNDDDPGAAE